MTQAELGPAAPDAHEAFAVVKDYDGHVPDTGELVICATEALAEEFAAWAAQNDPHGDQGEDDGYEWPFTVTSLPRVTGSRPPSPGPG